jgi:hypothetical protein
MTDVGYPGAFLLVSKAALIIAVVLVASSPARAQHVTDDSSLPVAMLRQQQVPMALQTPTVIHQEFAPQQMRPGVRYTTGYTQTRGWENNLIKGNSNLGHWNWSPMVSYTQSSPSRSTARQSNTAPNVVPRVCHYVKPIHVAMPLSELQISQMHAAQNCNGKLTNENVSCKLRNNPRGNGDCSGRLTNQSTMLSYGASDGSSSAYGAGCSVTKADVHGVIQHN